MPSTAYPTSSYGRKNFNYGFRDLIIATGMLPVLTNSEWTSSFFHLRFEPFTRIYSTHLGTDTQTFQPSSDNRLRIRQMHGLADDKLLVAIGADSNARLGKGSAEVEQICMQMADHANIKFISFGHSGLEGENIVNLGYQCHESSMAEIFQSTDIFLNMADIDCFGQVSIEAAACGCIPIVLEGTGTSEAIIHMRSGILVANKQDAIHAIDSLDSNRELLDAMSRSTQKFASEYFSLESQYTRWVKTLLLDAANKTPFVPHS